MLCFLRSLVIIEDDKKNALFLSVNVFSMKVLIRDTIFYVSNWRWDCHFTWSSEPFEGLACCSAKGVPSFLGYFKTLNIGPAPGIEPATSRSAVNKLYCLSQHCCGEESKSWSQRGLVWPLVQQCHVEMWKSHCFLAIKS